MYRMNDLSKGALMALPAHQMLSAAKAPVVLPHPDAIRGVALTVGATSPKAAMELVGGSAANSALPITVTITLTTVFWPRTAH
jgi:hypothetical protein